MHGIQFFTLFSVTDWFRSGVAEAICIATDRLILNRDRGWHTLPAIYSHLLSSRDTSDLSNNLETCADTEASVLWRRPEVKGRKLWISKNSRWCERLMKFYHVFSVSRAKRQIILKTFPTVYDNLGMSISKYESHPWTFANARPDFVENWVLKLVQSWFWPSRSLKVKSSSMAKLAIYDFLLVFNSN